MRQHQHHKLCLNTSNGGLHTPIRSMGYFATDQYDDGKWSSGHNLYHVNLEGDSNWVGGGVWLQLGCAGGSHSDHQGAAEGGGVRRFLIGGAALALALGGFWYFTHDGGAAKPKRNLAAPVQGGARWRSAPCR